MTKRNRRIMLSGVGVAGLLLAIPAVSQDNPESLLPPGFDDPPAPPAQPRPPSPSPSPSPSPPASSTGGQSGNSGADSDTPSPASPSAGSGASTSSGSSPSRPSAPRRAAKTSSDDDDDSLDDEIPRYDVPEAARRSLKLIGVITPDQGGFPADAYGDTSGEILQTIIAGTSGPLVSRWGTIIARRLLASRTRSPDGIKPQTWVADRAWLLLRLGENVTARQLVQEVDAGNFNKRLYTVGMQMLLANADLAGMCPLADRASIVVKGDKTWKMSRAICASLAAEQANASAFLRRFRRKGVMTGVDYRLAEKAVGAGIEGRRNVKIDWDGVKDMNAWRFGLAHATGIEPPARLYENTGKHLDGWRAQLPMLPINSRIDAASTAVSLGVLSNRAMVDMYAQALEDPDAGDAIKDRAEFLATAFAGKTASARVDAMRELWDNASGKQQEHAMLVLTARAAAAVAPSSELEGSADNLIRSMMTAGFDNSAAGWADIVPQGSLGWGLLAVGAPGMDGEISYGQLDDFYDEDDSDGYVKSKMLLAGLAGLDRVSSNARSDFEEELEFNLDQASDWTIAISAAADRGESGTVVLLAAAALQGSDWSQIEPRFIYHIVRALKAVGREPEARMIAAEAVSFS